jgi:signal peptidase I
MTRARAVRWTAGLVQATLWAGLAGVLGLLLLPRVTGYDVLIVRGGSMEPAIPAGGVEIIDRGARTPTVGDVVAFRENGSIVTHRVVGFEEGLMVTRGDANQTDDGMRRRPQDVVGTVVADVPYVGRMLYVVQQPLVFLLLLGLTGGVLIWSEVQVIYRKLRDTRVQHGDLEDSPTDA